MSSASSCSSESKLVGSWIPSLSESRIFWRILLPTSKVVFELTRAATCSAINPRTRCKYLYLHTASCQHQSIIASELRPTDFWCPWALWQQCWACPQLSPRLQIGLLVWIRRSFPESRQCWHTVAFPSLKTLVGVVSSNTRASQPLWPTPKVGRVAPTALQTSRGHIHNTRGRCIFGRVDRFWSSEPPGQCLSWCLGGLGFWEGTWWNLRRCLRRWQAGGRWAGAGIDPARAHGIAATIFRAGRDHLLWRVSAGNWDRLSARLVSSGRRRTLPCSIFY